MSRLFEIVAHRGIPTELPENTIPSFRRAAALGADAIELDVRLTRDRVPVVYHYFYLEEATTELGSIFDYTFTQIQDLEIVGCAGTRVSDCRIPTLEEVLDIFGGWIDLEIEIKGPEPGAPDIIGTVLNDFEGIWAGVEVTSYEPLLLRGIQQRCPGLATDLLFPRSEEWMGLDVVAYLATERARLAGARAVHLHPTQLLAEVVDAVRSSGIGVHAWEVDDTDALKQVVELGIRRICTNRLRQAIAFRDDYAHRD